MEMHYHFTENWEDWCFLTRLGYEVEFSHNRFVAMWDLLLLLFFFLYKYMINFVKNQNIYLFVFATGSRKREFTFGCKKFKIRNYLAKIW